MQIELLVVPNCPNQAAATDLITAALANTGVRANVTLTIVTSHAQARHRGFIGSPTFLIDGLDPFARPDAHVALACRLYSTPTGLRGVPALPELRRAVTLAAGE